MAPMVRDDEPVPPPCDPSDPPPARDEAGGASRPDDAPAGADLPDLLTIPGTRRSLLVRIVCLVLGSVCVLLGIVVWITPLVSGAIPLYLGGAVLLGMADPRIARWINHHERRRVPRKLRLWLRPRLRRQLLRAEREAAEVGQRDEGCADEARGARPANGPGAVGQATTAPEGEDATR